MAFLLSDSLLIAGRNHSPIVFLFVWDDDRPAVVMAHSTIRPRARRRGSTLLLEGSPHFQIQGYTSAPFDSLALVPHA